MSDLEISWTAIQGTKVPPESIVVEFNNKRPLLIYWNSQYGISRERKAFWRGVMFSCLIQAGIYLLAVFVGAFFK